MKTIETKDLTGPALAYAVAIAECLEEPAIEDGKCVYIHHEEPGDDGWWTIYEPHLSWEVGGPIIEREKLMIQPKLVNGDWFGTWRSVCLSWTSRTHSDVDGGSPLEAAMRCYVMSKLGYEIEVPEELEPAPAPAPEPAMTIQFLCPGNLPKCKWVDNTDGTPGSRCATCGETIPF